MFYTLIYKLLEIYSYPLQLTSTRYCKYSYMCSWWWVKIPPKTCRAVFQNLINCVKLHRGNISKRIYLWCTDPWTSKTSWYIHWFSFRRKHFGELHFADLRNKAVCGIDVHKCLHGMEKNKFACNYMLLVSVCSFVDCILFKVCFGRWDWRTISCRKVFVWHASIKEIVHLLACGKNVEISMCIVCSCCSVVNIGELVES